MIDHGFTAVDCQFLAGDEVSGGGVGIYVLVVISRRPRVLVEHLGLCGALDASHGGWRCSNEVQLANGEGTSDGEATIALPPT